jgi:hypothetical protein
MTSSNLLRQGHFLAFMDCFRVLCWITLAAVPLMLTVKKIQPGKSAPEGLLDQLRTCD